MKITLVEFEFGMTQNLGDYTNTRPSVKLVAEVGEDDAPDLVLHHLAALARTAVHDIVDNELELAGRQVKYYRGPLFRVWHSQMRECVVIARPGQTPPQEENWKHRDSWNSYIPEREFPTYMRWETAQEAAQLVQAVGWGIYDCSDGDFSIIPPLPDAEPEPLWLQKSLNYYLRNMGIDEAVWEELAALEHVTNDYLQQVYRRKYGRLIDDELLAFIRENSSLATVEPEPDDYDEEEYEGEDF